MKSVFYVSAIAKHTAKPKISKLVVDDVALFGTKAIDLYYCASCVTHFALHNLRKAYFHFFLEMIILMGIFINKGNEGARQIRNSEYVDKSGLIAVVNKTLFTQQKLSCR